MCEVGALHSHIWDLLRLDATVVVAACRVHSRVESLLIELLHELRLILDQRSLLVLQGFDLLLDEQLLRRHAQTWYEAAASEGLRRGVVAVLD